MNHNWTLIIGLVIMFFLFIVGLWAIDRDDFNRNKKWIREECLKFSKSAAEFKECIK